MVAILVGIDCNHDGNILDFTVLAMFEINTIYINIKTISGKWADTPGFDIFISLFIQVLLIVLGDSFIPHEASVISSIRRTETSAGYIWVNASSTLLRTSSFKSHFIKFSFSCILLTFIVYSLLLVDLVMVN